MIGCTTCCYDFAGCGGTHVSLPCAPSFVRPVVCAPRRLCAPSFLLIMASFALSLLATPHAQAGTYIWQTKDANGKITAQSPACTGGTATGMFYTGPGSPVPTQAYNLISSNTYGGSGGRISNPSCKGTITATLTWQADPTKASDPPPPSGSVVVMETCTASASAQVGANATCSAQCDDGMGQPGSTQSSSGVPNYYNTATPPQPTQYLASVSTSDTRYTVQGGATITLTLSPTSSATASASNGPGGWQAGATVSYTVSVSPVTINLGGTIPDSSGNYNILIGQACTPSISAGPFTLSNFQWSAGPIFDKFLIASDQSSGYATFLSAAALTQPNPTWHWYLDSGAGSFMVSCSATASINGTVVGTVKGQQQVKVWPPYYYMKHNAGPTGVYGMDVSTGGPSQVPPGMSFVGAVGTPALFVNSGNTGSWLFVQIINTDHGQYYPFSPTELASGSQGIALDNEWPYTPGWAADSTANASTPHSTDDSPDLLLNNSVDEFIIQDTYQMYMMYSPPAQLGYDTQYVPLHCLTWAWDTNSYVKWGPSGWPAGAAGTVSVTSDLRWETHPSWSKKYTH